MLRGILLGLLLATMSAVLCADAPDVTGLMPSGGQRGTEVTVRAVDSKGARRGRGGGRRKRGEPRPEQKVDKTEWRLWADAPGIELGESEADDILTLKLAADVSPGLHWLRFYTADGASGLRPFVVGEAGELAEIEPNDVREKAQTVAELPATVNGTLEKSGDVDTYGVQLAAGQTLVAVLAAKQTLGSPMDGILQVVDARGFVQEQNDDQRGFDSRVVFTATNAGTYYVRAFAFPAAPDTTVRFSGAPTYIYRLTIAAGLFLDSTVPCAVTANAPTKVRAGGWNLPQPEVALDLPALAPGVQPIFAAGWVSTAKVLAVASPVVVEQEPNPVAQPQMMALPSAASGAIGEPRDVDAWKVSAKTGQKLSIRVAATALGSALDAVVRVFDSAGAKLAEVDDAPQGEADVLLEFAVPKDGDYFIAVTDRFAHGGPGHWYALCVAEAVPTIALATAADAFSVKPDAPLEIPVTVERRSGFALPATITVSGLPEGVTVDAVVSEPQGDLSKLVKLTVKSVRTEPWSGPIRIAGKAEGMAQEFDAQFPSPLTGDRQPHLWLTVLPKP